MRNNASANPTSAQSSAANRYWWDLDADNYHAEHSAYLESFYWCPEMLHEADAQLLGGTPALAGKRVLEIGCGSAPCSSWLAQQSPAPALTAAFDISRKMLDFAPRDAQLVQADAEHFPFCSNSFDVVFSAFGAIPFVADSQAVMAEVARVLRPGGRFVFAITHPMRWIFPDNPGEPGLTVFTSYFDRTPYTEVNDEGEFTYVEHHRTLGDRVRELVAAGFVLDDLIEPEWPEHLTETWGQWSPLRGKLFPGTAIFVAHLPQ